MLLPERISAAIELILPKLAVAANLVNDLPRLVDLNIPAPAKPGVPKEVPVIDTNSPSPVP